MPYQSEDDPVVEALNGLAWGVIGFFAGLLAAIGFYGWQRAVSTPRLPETLEDYLVPDKRSMGERFFGVLNPLVFALYLVVMLVTLFISLRTFVFFLIFSPACILVWGMFSEAQSSAAPQKIRTLDFPPLPAPRRYRILLPKDSPWHAEAATHLIEHVLRISVHLALRIVATPGQIEWEILDWRTGVPPELLRRAVTAYYPDAEILDEDVSPDERLYPFDRALLFFKPVSDFVWPIKSAADVAHFDPLATITQAMADLEEGERITYSLILSLPATYANREGLKLITRSQIHPLQLVSGEGRGKAAAALASGEIRVDKYVPTDQRVAAEKLDQPLYQCFLAVEIESLVPGRVEELAALDSHIWHFAREPYNGLVVDSPSESIPVRTIRSASEEGVYSTLAAVMTWADHGSDGWKRTRLILCPQEIAALWHLPHQGFLARDIQWSSGRNVAAPTAATRRYPGAAIGRNVHSGKRTFIRLADADRALHTYVVGKTGVGKSTLLHHVIHQDIAAGKGVGVIDPHGKLVRDILRTSIPPERENDVVLVDFAQTAYPAPLNPFAVPQGVPREVVLNHVMGVLKKIYAEDWSRTRMENALYSALVALMDEPHATPRDIARLMVDAEYRTALMQHVKDPVALEYWWDEYDTLSEAMQAQVREPVLNRIRIFYRNPVVRNMICHPMFIDFRAVMEEGKIFLANLNSDETRSEQANLGAMLMASFQMAAMTRSTTDGGPRPFYLFVEEVQQFVTSALPVVFSEARKFGLSLTAANQYLGQLRGSTLEAILGNAGATIMFACGPDDAHALSGYLAPNLTPGDLMNFDRFHAAVKMQVAGKTLPAFSIETLSPLPEPPDASERELRIRKKSISQYTPWTRQQVETWLAQRYDQPRKRRPVGTISDFD